MTNAEQTPTRQCALEQAVAFCRGDDSLTARDVLDVACQFEKYLNDGRNPETQFMATLASHLEEADVAAGLTRPMIEKISKFLYERGCLLQPLVFPKKSSPHS